MTKVTIIGEGYTRAELLAIQQCHSSPPNPCKCFNYEPTEAEDWVGVHVQLIAEGI